MKNPKKPHNVVSGEFVTIPGLDTPPRFPMAKQGKDGSLLIEENRAMLLECQAQVRKGQRVYGRYAGVEQEIEKPRVAAEEGNDLDPPKRHPYLDRNRGAADPNVVPMPTDPAAKEEYNKQLKLQNDKKLDLQNRLEASFNPKPFMGG